MLLRSLIAPGYMLDTKPADGSLLAISLCDGPAGINAIAALDEDHNHHHEHHHNNQPEQTSQEHGFSACSFWSSSSQLLLTEINLADLRTITVADEAIFYQEQILPRHTNRSNLARAPPVLS